MIFCDLMSIVNPCNERAEAEDTTEINNDNAFLSATNDFGHFFFVVHCDMCFMVLPLARKRLYIQFTIIIDL
jgi:hypothetical protein